MWETHVWELEDNSGSWADPGIKLRSGYQAWMKEPSPAEPSQQPHHGKLFNKV